MGCMSTKQSQIQIPTQFKTNQKISQSIYMPQFSYLYNLLRKRKEIQIIKKSNIQQLLFFGQIVMELMGENVKVNDVKLLCGFKNVVLVGFNRQQGEYLKSITTPKAIYLISYERSKQFLQQFPIFITNSPKLQPKNIPILAFHEQQLIKSTNKQQNKRIIFLHSQKYQNTTLYKTLKVEHIVNQKQCKNNKQIINGLKKQGIGKILYLHKRDRKQEDLLEVLVGFVEEQYKIRQQNTKIYFANILPQTKHVQLQHIPKSAAIIPLQNPTQSLTQNFMTNFIKLQSQITSALPSSSQSATSKVQRAYNLLITLISNIYNNKQSDNFRKVRRTNKQINDLLGKYQTGIKLLKDVGFVDQSGWYVNNTDGKYLKLFRMDLEVGYKQYIANIKK